MAKTATKKQHREYRAVPYLKVAKMWYEGKSYLQIGKAIDRLAPEGDVTKPVRAIVSRMAGVGYPDENGNIIKLKPREGMRAIGFGKKAPGNGKTKATAKPAAKSRKAGSTGPAVLIALHSSGKFVRLEVGKAKALPKVESVLPSMIEVVEKAGYTVTHNTVAQIEEAAVAAPAPTPEATTQAGSADPANTTEVTVTEPTPTEAPTTAAPVETPAPQADPVENGQAA